MNIISRSFQLAFDAVLNRKTGTTGHYGSAPCGFFRIMDNIKRRRQIKRGIRQLSALSNDTLQDIGIERGNIPALVKSMNNASTGEQPVKVGASTELQTARSQFGAAA